MASPLEKLLRAGEGRIIKRLQGVAKAVNALEEDYTHLSDEELRGETAELRSRYEAGETLDQLMDTMGDVGEAANRDIAAAGFELDEESSGDAGTLSNFAQRPAALETSSPRTLAERSQ